MTETQTYKKDKYKDKDMVDIRVFLKNTFLKKN